jgi:hypothetical protein
VAKPKPRRSTSHVAKRYYYNSPWGNGRWYARPW